MVVYSKQSEACIYWSEYRVSQLIYHKCTCYIQLYIAYNIDNIRDIWKLVLLWHFWPNWSLDTTWHLSHDTLYVSLAMTSYMPRLPSQCLAVTCCKDLLLCDNNCTFHNATTGPFSITNNQCILPWHTTNLFAMTSYKYLCYDKHHVPFTMTPNRSLCYDKTSCVLPLHTCHCHFDMSHYWSIDYDNQYLPFDIVHHWSLGYDNQYLPFDMTHYWSLG